MNNTFHFTDHHSLSELTGTLCYDPWWTYELFDAGCNKFVNNVVPDSEIPVSSVNLLIYKECSILDEECVDLDSDIHHLDSDAPKPGFPSFSASTICSTPARLSWRPLDTNSTPSSATANVQHSTELSKAMSDFNFEKYKFSSSDSESPWKTSLYAIWTSQIGDGHLTLSWYPHTILGIAGYTGRIRTWDVDILILLNISHMVQVEQSKSDNFDFFTAGFSKPFWVVLPN